MIETDSLSRRLTIKDSRIMSIATDNQAVQHFQERIEAIRKKIITPIRGPHLRRRKILLHICGDLEYSDIGELKAERSRAQELLFRVMSSYGLDTDISYEKRDKYIENLPDGTSGEIRIYPSQTIKGIEFERTRYFFTDTGETTSVFWDAVDRGSLVKMNIKGLFRRKPKPQIKLD